MKALFLIIGFLSFPCSLESSLQEILSNDYDLSGPYDSTFPPGPYDSFREELVVDQVIEESSDFKIKARNVKQWLRLRMDRLYLLGISDKEVSLVSMYKDKRQHNQYRVHEYPVALQYQVSCGVMFKSQRPKDDSFEGVVMLALKSPRPIISVYKIKHLKLHHIIDWTQEYGIHAIRHFKWHGEDRLIIFEELKYVSRASVYGFEVDDHSPHLWRIEMIPLGSTRGYPTLGMSGGNSLFLATIQNNINAVNIYSYKTVCVETSGYKFDQMLTIPDLIATKIEFFQGYGHLYFIVSGAPSVLFRLTADGYLLKDVIFGSSVEMLPVPINSAHHDTILLGKSRNGTPHIYTSIGHGMWEERKVPETGLKCQRSSELGKELVDLEECIGGSRSWDGVTYIEMEGDQYPAILFADQHHSNQLYYLPFSLIKIPTMQPSFNPFVLDRLESYWNNLRTSLRKLITGRSHEDKSQTISSFCSIEKELNDMHDLLSSIKMPLDWTNCSISVPQMDVSPETESLIIDEAKPITIITNPNQRVLDDHKSPPEETLRNDQHFSLYNTVRGPNYPKHGKSVPISPEISTRDIGEIVTEQNDGYMIT
ncbi:hypothetical protein GE061_001074 [Apolygus lucorum]|uniref:Uncharacterized protein n=1 Tax=Apolygus lucorum TaxID=248454 RepID=A0A6A4ITM4_APOLU|nr:hypothetical protein GE061_001074 [Apolygus lucorum]